MDSFTFGDNTADVDARDQPSPVSMREFEYGRFSYWAHTYVVASSSAPNTIRVRTAEPDEWSILCTISGVETAPVASWGMAWLHCPNEWYDAVEKAALNTYRIAIEDQATTDSPP